MPRHNTIRRAGLRTEHGVYWLIETEEGRAVLGLLIVIALMCIAGGPDTEADLMAHGAWMAGLKELGTWVMW